MMWDEYKNAVDGLSFSKDFEENTISALNARAKAIDAERKEKELMRKNFWMKMAAGVAAASIFAGSAYAAVTMLNPADTARELGHERLAEAFDKDGVDLSDQGVKQIDDYDVALEGIVSGKGLTDTDDEIDVDRTYAAISVKRSDGKPITAEEAYGEYAEPGDDEAAERIENAPDKSLSAVFSASPLIGGYAPWRVNGWTLGAFLQTFLKDGVMYFLYEADNLEFFADHNVYFAFYQPAPGSGFVPDVDTFKMNPDGTIEFADSYKGEGEIFLLPLDETKADPKAAAEIVAPFVGDDDDVAE